MEQLATFLTSPEVAPGAPGHFEPQIETVGPQDPSPEAAGIFRIFRANADPIPAESAEATGAADKNGGSVPMPRHHPATEAVSALETLKLAAASK